MQFLVTVPDGELAGVREEHGLKNHTDEDLISETLEVQFHDVTVSKVE